MKILALERETHNVAAEQFLPHLKAEAARVWELVQAIPLMPYSGLARLLVEG
jgi:hypothetical protein